MRVPACRSEKFSGRVLRPTGDEHGLQEKKPSLWSQTPGLNLDAVGLDLVVKGLAADAQALGGFEFVAAGFF